MSDVQSQQSKKAGLDKITENSYILNDLIGRIAQPGESACLTSRRSEVQVLFRPFYSSNNARRSM